MPHSRIVYIGYYGQSRTANLLVKLEAATRLLAQPHHGVLLRRQDNAGRMQLEAMTPGTKTLATRDQIDRCNDIDIGAAMHKPANPTRKSFKGL
jgi:hypothetical protein